MLSIDPADEDSDEEGGSRPRPPSSVATSRALSAMAAAGPPGGSAGAGGSSGTAASSAGGAGTPYPSAVNSTDNPVIVNSTGGVDMTRTVMRPPTPFENNIDSRPPTPHGKQAAPQENSLPNAHSNTNSTGTPNDVIMLSDDDSNDASKVS